jgi:hypothetical protein
MAADDLARACPQFAESNRIDPKPGTLINLALCHERQGRTASAWAEYIQAAEVAARIGQSDRQRVASEHAHSLEPQLSYIVVDAPPVPGETVTLDDRRLGPGAFGTAIPVDPGAHAVRASAPGREPFLANVTISANGEHVSVDVRRLWASHEAASLPPTPRPSTPIPAVAPIRATTTAVRDARSFVSPRSFGKRADTATWGVAVGGVGVALLGVGAAFGLRAFAEHETADNSCDAHQCTAGGESAITAMKSAEAISTISSAAGIAAAGVGLYLVLSSPRRVNSLSTGASPGSLRIGPDAGLHGAQLVWTW